MALLAPVLGQAPPRDELLATGGAGVARLLGQVLHLHVLDQVALVAHGLLADEADVLAGGQQVALERNEGVRLSRGCEEPS